MLTVKLIFFTGTFLFFIPVNEENIVNCIQPELNYTMPDQKTSSLPIMIVEDDQDDIKLLTDAFINIGVKNKCICFHSAKDALEYLNGENETPLVIISDINMPYMDGLVFKTRINADERLDQKKIPFVFLTTSGSSAMVKEAFNLCVQGYFQKPTEFSELNSVARSIVEYWNRSKLPQMVA